jgi:hypothetical protein
MTLKDWKQKTALSKILTIIGLILSITIVILLLLQIFNVWDKTENICALLSAILMLIQAIEIWKTNRSVAIVALFTAIVVFVSTILVLF